jgi:hypothetical protein
MQLRQSTLQTNLSSQYKSEESSHFRPQITHLNPEYSCGGRLEIALGLCTFLDCQGTEGILSVVLLICSQVQKLLKLQQTSVKL